MATAFRAPTASVFYAICTILFRSVLSRIWTARRQGRKWYTWGATCVRGPWRSLTLSPQKAVEQCPTHERDKATVVGASRYTPIPHRGTRGGRYESKPERGSLLLHPHYSTFVLCRPHAGSQDLLRV